MPVMPHGVALVRRRGCGVLGSQTIMSHVEAYWIGAEPHFFRVVDTDHTCSVCGSIYSILLIYFKLPFLTNMCMYVCKSARVCAHELH